jgi:hypothetical protein
MAHWHRLGVAVGLTALVGCGSSMPEAPRSGPSTGAADAIVTSPAGAASGAGRPAQDARVQTAAAPATPPPSDAPPPAEQAQREAREQWVAELRESPDATVRLQALELWAQQPGDTIDPLTYALVDEDEEVRARAEELEAQQRTREEEAETAL